MLLLGLALATNCWTQNFRIAFAGANAAAEPRGIYGEGGPEVCLSLQDEGKLGASEEARAFGQPGNQEPERVSVPSPTERHRERGCLGSATILDSSRLNCQEEMNRGFGSQALAVTKREFCSRFLRNGAGRKR